MGVYSVRGFTAATGTTDPMTICQLWNPDAAERIKVLEFGVFVSTAIISSTQNAPAIVRSTARGTAGSTVTPDADNSWDNLAAPPSGALLDLALFSVEPTRSTPKLLAWNVGGGATTGSAGLGFMWANPKGVEVPPGSGLCIEATVGGVNAWPASECFFVWEEGF